MPNCYCYDEQRNRCNCYVNKNFDELLAENAKLRELCADLYAIRDRSGTYHVAALQVRLDELGVEVNG